MTRRIYIWLLRLHPRPFRERFGEEMLGIFDTSAEKSSLITDAVLSIGRQWALRRPEPALSRTPIADGVPVFYSAQDEGPRMGVLLPAVFVTLLMFAAIDFVMSHRWAHTSFVVGSHHPSPSHILGVRTDATPVTDLPVEVKLKPYPFHPPISPYFRLILVLGALDADQDNVISAEEIANAASALWTLDTNRDGKLSAEECGLKPDARLDRALLGQMRLSFMRIHPVLAALDANHDGQISDAEIRNAAHALGTLDANGDGRLTLQELLPDRATAQASGIMQMLDKNGDGKISREERVGPVAERFRRLLEEADRKRIGFVTEDDLVRELSRQ